MKKEEKKESTEKKVEKRISHSVTELGSKGKLIITRKVKAQIDQLHRIVGNKEWCGFILYEKVSGNITDPSTYVAKTTGLYLMDIGSETYTASDNNPLDIVEMDKRVPEFMTSRYGLVHTHHTMTAYFSGTDIQELHTNVGNYSYYLSLILSMRTQYVAKVVKLVTFPENAVELHDEDDNSKGKVTLRGMQTMISFDLDVEIEGQEEDPIVDLRVKELLEIKKKEKALKFSSGYKFPSGHTSAPAHGHELPSFWYDDTPSGKKGRQLTFDPHFGREEMPTSIVTSHTARESLRQILSLGKKDPNELGQIFVELASMTKPELATYLTSLSKSFSMSVVTDFGVDNAAEAVEYMKEILFGFGRNEIFEEVVDELYDLIESEEAVFTEMLSY